MTDPNRNIIGKFARRPVERPAPQPPPPPTSGQEWNAPIDITQADSMTNQQVIRGEAEAAKKIARSWSPGMTIHYPHEEKT